MHLKHKYKERLKVKKLNKNRKRHFMHTNACTKNKKAKVAVLI